MTYVKTCCPHCRDVAMVAMHELNVLLTCTGGLGAALLLGYLAQRLKLSPIVGYLLAGIAVCPFTPGFIAHQPVAEQFAEIGVILLLFGIGLRFHLRILVRCAHLRDVDAIRRAGATVVAAGEAEVAVALAEAVIADNETA